METISRLSPEPCDVKKVLTVAESLTSAQNVVRANAHGKLDRQDGPTRDGADGALKRPSAAAHR